MAVSFRPNMKRAVAKDAPFALNSVFAAATTVIDAVLANVLFGPLANTGVFVVSPGRNPKDRRNRSPRP